MINFKALRVNLATLVKELTENVVIFSNQNANTPSGDYIVLKVSSVRFIGATDWQGNPNEDELAETQGDREVVLSVQVISESSMEILLDLVNKLNLNSKLELLTSKKLAYVNLDGDISDITVQINNSFENRATADLVFRISKNYYDATDEEGKDNIGIVTSVGMSGQLDGNGLEDPVEIDLTVTTE